MIKNEDLYAGRIQKNNFVLHLIGTVVGAPASVSPSGSPHITPTKPSPAAPGPTPTTPKHG